MQMLRMMRECALVKRNVAMSLASLISDIGIFKVPEKSLKSVSHYYSSKCNKYLKCCFSNIIIFSQFNMQIFTTIWQNELKTTFTQFLLEAHLYKMILLILINV